MNTKQVNQKSLRIGGIDLYPHIGCNYHGYAIYLDVSYFGQNIRRVNGDSSRYAAKSFSMEQLCEGFCKLAVLYFLLEYIHYNFDKGDWSAYHLFVSCVCFCQNCFPRASFLLHLDVVGAHGSWASISHPAVYDYERFGLVELFDSINCAWFIQCFGRSCCANFS